MPNSARRSSSVSRSRRATARPRPGNTHDDRGRNGFGRRSLWTGSAGAARRRAGRPGTGRFGGGMGEILGYARVSTGEQDVAGQELRLRRAGAAKMFTDVRSGRSMDRPGLAALLDYARDGDTLAVVRLDRLGRSLGELLATVAMLKERGIALRSL